MKNFKISVPQPCQEDWNTMTINKKGRFCNSCSKTVIDFTKKSAKEIQDYFIESRGKNICGHFKTEQLDSIVIQIPESVFTTQLSFQKLFILTLLLIMGTSLFSCKTDEGESQKIEKVELTETIIKTEKVIDTIIKQEKVIDTIKTTQTTKQIAIPPPIKINTIKKNHGCITGTPRIAPVSPPVKDIPDSPSIGKTN